MDRNPSKRQVKDLLEKAVEIGELLELDKVATFNMAWKEPRLDLPGGGECYPLIDVLERLASVFKEVQDGLKEHTDHPTMHTKTTGKKPKKDAGSKTV
jgi:hypothetical protein